MNEAVEKAHKLGYSTIILETNKLHNKAIHIYENYGFKPYSASHFSSKCDFAMQKTLINS